MYSVPPVNGTAGIWPCLPLSLNAVELVDNPIKIFDKIESKNSVFVRIDFPTERLVCTKGKGEKRTQFLGVLF